MDEYLMLEYLHELHPVEGLNIHELRIYVNFFTLLIIEELTSFSVTDLLKSKACLGFLIESSAFIPAQ